MKRNPSPGTRAGRGSLLLLFSLFAAACGSDDPPPAAGSGGIPSTGGVGNGGALSNGGAGPAGSGSFPSGSGGAPASGGSSAGGTPTGGTGGGSSGGSGAGGDGGTLTPEEDIQPPHTLATLKAQRCDVARPTFFYRSSTGDHSAPAVPPAGSVASVPCVTYTDRGSAEPSLAVTSDGTVHVAPAFTADGSQILSSSDLGVTWKARTPRFPNGGGHGRTQPYLYVDPATDRMFFFSTASAGVRSPAANGMNLTFSADKGETWSYVNVIPEAFDWIKIFAGKPVSSTTQGYPNALYISAPTPISTPVPVVELFGVKPNNQPVFKSLNGGTTWTKVADRSLLPANVPGCDPNEWVIYGNGLVNAQGTIFQVLRRCREIVVTKSVNEGATWTFHSIPGGTLPPFDTRNLLQIVANPNILVTELLTSDSEGNLYVAWVDAQGRLRLVHSKDGAATWSAPVTVSAPDVRDVRYASLATKAPGVLALAYYGSTDGIRFHGYIAETLNAFEPEPSFSSVTVNDPKEPLYDDGFEVGYLGILNNYDLNEIVHVKYAPNGDLWASFTKDMCKGVEVKDCKWDAAAHANSPGQAVIGRLVHGVRSAYAEAKPFVKAAQCDPASAASRDACYTVATSEAICTALKTCACDDCHCELLHCQDFEQCAKVRSCATKNNCRGLDCIFACGTIAYTAGELMTSMALEVATCLTANSCPTSCPLF